MNLEDHLGDIIRKARSMTGVSLNTAAHAARLSEAALSALESEGTFSERPDLIALANVIGLNPTKLEHIANGWLPTEKDLNTWRHLQVFTSASDGMSVNCFLIWDETTREAALFDTGFDADVILKTLTTQQLQLRHIFITHSHFDHVHALGRIRAAHADANIHSSSKNAPPAQRNRAEDIISVGTLQITHRETPGHAADGVTYIISGWPSSAPQVAIVGDTIFAGSMGCGNDSWQVARQKVREEILTLPPDTLLCPGHGPLTTVTEERVNNPFF